MEGDYSSDIQNAVEVLKNGGVILYPTDTIWGLGCDATNPQAVDKIFKIKKRRESKSFIVLIDEFKHLRNYIQKVPDIAYDLLKSIENPLTVIYSDAKNLAQNAVAQDSTIAIRIPKNNFCKDLIKAFGKPITSTSANISGQVAPVSYQQIAEEVLQQADYAVKYKQNEFIVAKPSTIIRLHNDGNYDIVRN